jgi:hypothetical protein
MDGRSPTGTRSMRRLFLKTPDYLIDLVEAAAPNARSN